MMSKMSHVLWYFKELIIGFSHSKVFKSESEPKNEVKYVQKVGPKDG